MEVPLVSRSSSPRGFGLRRRVKALDLQYRQSEADNSELRTEIRELRRRFEEEKRRDQDEIQRLKALNRELKEKNVIVEPIAETVKTCVDSVVNIHKELQGEIGDFQNRTIRRIRNREEEVCHLYLSRIKQLESQLANERKKNQPLQIDKNPWQKISTLERKLQESVDFHSQILAENQVLREKCKEIQATEEVALRGNTVIMQSNARLKRLLEDSKLATQSPSQHDQGTQDFSNSSEYGLSAVARSNRLQTKRESAQKEARDLAKELSDERGKRTELEQVLAKCLEDVRSQSVALEAYSGRYKGTLTDRGRETLIQKLLLEEKFLLILQAHAFPVGILKAYMTDVSPLSTQREGSKASLCTKSSVLFNLRSPVAPRSRSVVRFPKPPPVDF